MAKSPAPLNLPRPLAPTTVPTTCAPRGKTVVPPDVFTGPANSPVNPSPTFTVFVLSSCVIVTGIVVPLGTVKRVGAGGGGGTAGAAVIAEAGAAAGSGAAATGAATGADAGAGAGVTGAADGVAAVSG